MGLDEKLHILDRLNAAEALERFLDTKYVGQKRFGIEGAEGAIVVLDAVLDKAADVGMDSVIMGMAHRGRLNVLVNIVGKDYEQLFGEFEGNLDEASTQGSGDVKYHLGMSAAFESRAGNRIGVELAANPSHLEAVNPVVEGMVRSRLDRISHEEGEHSPVEGLVRGPPAQRERPLSGAAPAGPRRRRLRRPGGGERRRSTCRSSRATAPAARCIW